MAMEENKNLPPNALEVLPDNIPPEMKARPYWVVWKYGDWDGKKYPKNLYNPNAPCKMASSTDPRTCGPFSKVWGLYQDGKFDGIGFVFYGDFSGVDIDHVINKETGAIDEGAAGTIARLNTYTEYSPSGTGTHSYFLGGFDGPACGHVGYSPYEIYQKGRFFTVTGHVYGNPLPIRKGGEDLQTFVNEERERRTTWKKGRNDTHIKENGLFPAGNPAASSPDPLPAAVPSSPVGMEGKPLDDETGNSYNPTTPGEVIAAIRKHAPAKQQLLFTALFDDGDISAYGDNRNAADMALVNLLPFWCKGNTALMHDVFMESALAKRRAVEDPKKYARLNGDYWERTARAALATWNGVSYNPDAWKKAKQAETGADRWTLDTIPPDAAARMSWPDTVKKKIGKEEKAFPRIISPQNMAYMLDKLQIKARFNLLSWTAEYSGPGATYHNAAGKVTTLGRETDENAAVLLLKSAAVRMGWNVETKDKDFREVLSNVIMSDSYNPACEYLEGAGAWYEKEGKDRDYIGELFDKIDIVDEYAGYKDFYKSVLFRKWVVSAVVAAYNTMERHIPLQGVLIFTSPIQGIGKSSFLPLIVPYAARRGLWVKSEGDLDPADKDSVISSTSYWLYEISEIDDLLQDKRNRNPVKRFFTRDTDDYRRPYGKKYMKRPRMTAFFGTANVSEMIADPTGGRRFWPVPIKSLSRLPRLDFTRANEEWEMFLKGVWGQAVTLMKSGYSISLSKEESQKLAAINSNFEYVSSLEQLFRDKLATSTSTEKYDLTATQVCKALEVRNPESSAGHMGRILNKYADRGIIERIRSHKAGKLYRVPFLPYPFNNDDTPEPVPEKPNQEGARPPP